MKKTEYFSGRYANYNNVDATIRSATDERDSWLELNKSKIAKIDREDIKMVFPTQNMIIAIITLTYFEKV